MLTEGRKLRINRCPQMHLNKICGIVAFTTEYQMVRIKYSHVEKVDPLSTLRFSESRHINVLMNNSDMLHHVIIC